MPTPATASVPAAPPAADAKRLRFLRSDVELDGSAAGKRIYKAYDTDEGVEVAMHVVATKTVAAAAGGRYTPHRLEHEHLIQILDSWVEGDSVAYVTPIVTAGTLQGYINRIDDVRYRVVRKWCWQLLEGLGYMHAAGCAHGDLRLANVYINGETGNVLLGSFVLGGDVASGDPDGTGGIGADAAAAMRALQYAPPEALPPPWGPGASPPTPAGDVYAFGMCVLEMVTRRAPYSAYGPDDAARLAADKAAGVLPPEVALIGQRLAVSGSDDASGGAIVAAAGSAGGAAAASASVGDGAKEGWTADEVRAVMELTTACLAADPRMRPTVAQLLEMDFLGQQPGVQPVPTASAAASTSAGSAQPAVAVAQAAPTPAASPSKVPASTMTVAHPTYAEALLSTTQHSTPATQRHQQQHAPQLQHDAVVALQVHHSVVTGPAADNAAPDEQIRAQSDDASAAHGVSDHGGDVMHPAATAAAPLRGDAAGGPAAGAVSQLTHPTVRGGGVNTASARSRAESGVPMATVGADVSHLVNTTRGDALSHGTVGARRGASSSSSSADAVPLDDIGSATSVGSSVRNAPVAAARAPETEQRAHGAGSRIVSGGGVAPSASQPALGSRVSSAARSFPASSHSTSTVPATASRGPPAASRRPPPRAPRLLGLRLVDVHVSSTQPRLDGCVALFYDAPAAAAATAPTLNAAATSRSNGATASATLGAVAYRHVKFSVALQPPPAPPPPLGPSEPTAAQQPPSSVIALAGDGWVRVASEMLMANLVASADHGKLCAWLRLALDPLLGSSAMAAADDPAGVIGVGCPWAVMTDAALPVAASARRTAHGGTDGGGSRPTFDPVHGSSRGADTGSVADERTDDFNHDGDEFGTNTDSADVVHSGAVGAHSDGEKEARDGNADRSDTIAGRTIRGSHAESVLVRRAKRAMASAGEPISDVAAGHHVDGTALAALHSTRPHGAPSASLAGRRRDGARTGPTLHRRRLLDESDEEGGAGSGGNSPSDADHDDEGRDDHDDVSGDDHDTNDDASRDDGDDDDDDEEDDEGGAETDGLTLARTSTVGGRSRARNSSGYRSPDDASVSIGPGTSGAPMHVGGTTALPASLGTTDDADASAPAGRRDSAPPPSPHYA